MKVNVYYTGKLPFSSTELEQLPLEILPVEAPAQGTSYFTFKDERLYFVKDEQELSFCFEEYFSSYELEAPSLSKEPLGKALGLTKGKEMLIFDASFGTGKDAALLAYWGQRVQGCERDPILYTLVFDALRRLSLSERFSRYGEFISYQFGEASDAFGEARFDRIYFDPMYPEKKGKYSAKTKKSMEFMKNFLGVDKDQKEVFLELWKRCPFVVVKRNPRSELIHENVNAQWKSKSLRLDKYLR